MKLKRGRLGRALSLAKLGGKVALGQGRRVLSRDQMAVHRDIATALVNELGELKGLPMKIGQLLSYMDGVVPDEYRDAYQEILGRLRTHSDPMAWDVAESVFVEELGKAPDEVFESFEREPIASASIGQVYRAQYEGQQVCVKIQYPGIADATLEDLKNIDSIVGIMRTLMPNVDTRQMVDDFRERLAEECDYRREAAYQARFANIYAEDSDLLVPGPIPELCERRVLTTHFIEGESLQIFAERADAERRSRAGMSLYRFAFGTLLHHGLFHADPHPGNLLFDCGERRRLGVLDYGCVQPIDAEARRDIGEMLRIAVAGGDLNEATSRALGIVETDDETAAAVTRITRRVLDPILGPQPYRFTRTFAAEISRAVVQAKADLALHYLSRRGGFVARREGVMFVVRNLFGLATIWGTLEAQGDFRELTASLLD